MDPLNRCGNPPADAEKLEADLRRAIPFMREQVNGKFNLVPHSSTYCRDLTYREPFLSLYRTVVGNGGEIGVHTHEELVGTAPLVHLKRHMEAIILQKRDELVAAGIQPTAFRMGMWAFDDCIPSILEKAGIDVDLSAVPGLERWYWHAYWRNAPYSAYYLCSQDYTHVDCSHPKSKVLEIPLGSDGLGDTTSKNFLYIDAAPLAEIQRVWDAIIKRAESAREPQFVHALCNLFCMGRDDLMERLASFLQYAQSHGGVVVTPSEAKRTFDMLRSCEL